MASPKRALRLVAALAFAGVAWVIAPGADLPLAGGHRTEALSAASATPAPAPLAALVPAGPTLPVPSKTGEGAAPLGTGGAPAIIPVRQPPASLLRSAARARALRRTSLDYMHRLALARSGLISSRSTAPPPPLG